MKKLLLFFAIILLSAQLFAQSSPILKLRIQSASVAFGQNIPIGTEITNIATGETWRATAAVLGTATLTSAAGSFTPVTYVTGTLPIVSTGAPNPVISINGATETTAGSLSAADKVRIDNVRLIQNHDSLSALDERSHASLTNILGAGSYHVSLSQRDSILSAEQHADTVRNAGYATNYKLSLRESPLTFSSGLTRTLNNVTNDLITGKAGGQTVIGGTGVTDVLNLQGTSANGTLTSPAIKLNVGNNGATNAVTVLNNGNVGIGTTNPTTKLQIADPTAAIVTAVSGTRSIKFGAYAGDWNYNTSLGAPYLLGTQDAYPFYIYTSNLLRVLVTTGGNVGIGTTSPSSALDVNGTYSKSGINLFLDPLRTGYAGTAGQVLTSGGISSTPTWATPTTGTVTSVATGLGLSGGTITTSGTIALDTANVVVLSRQRAANTYALKGNYLIKSDTTSLVSTKHDLTLKINTSEVGANNGVASLDPGGKVPFSQLPAALMIYKGLWDPSTNTPTLSDASGVAGWVYKCSANGTANTGSGAISYLVGDFAIHNGTIWQRSVGTDNVVSVNTQQGVVSLNTDNIPEGTTNKYYLDSRARAALSGTAPITYNSTTGAIGITQATGSTSGYVSNIDWTAFNAKLDSTLATYAMRNNWNTAYTNRITSLTTTGTSDAF